MKPRQKWMVEKDHPEESAFFYKGITLSFLGVIFMLIYSGCTVTRYADGNITEYVKQPIPKLEKPIAATLNLEIVSYITSVNMNGILVSDLANTEIYVLSRKIGKQVEGQLELGEEFSEEATLEALNTIAMGRTDARGESGKDRQEEISVSSNANSAISEQYVNRQSQLASEAYAKGDYLNGNIHNNAAVNHIKINSAFSQAEASVSTAFAVLGVLATMAEIKTKNDFNSLKNWIETNTGAISPEAPEDRNLSIFFLQFFDAKKFRLDSRFRVAVLLVLTDEDGIQEMILEGSDIQICANKCNVFQRKENSVLLNPEDFSEDIKENLWNQDGFKMLDKSGFDTLIGGFYHYLLLQQGLQKLQLALAEKER